MADNYTTNPGTGGSTFAADDVGGILVPRVKLQHGADGSAVDASAAAPLPVADAAAAAALATLITTTDGVEAALASLLAANAAQALTDAQLRAAAVAITAASLPLPAGAATSALQTAANTALATLLTQTDGIEASLTSVDAKLPAQSGGRLPVATATGTLVNRSGTITAGGTAQQLAAANAARLGFSVQNLSTTADLWINTLGTAAADQPSLKLAPGVYFETPAGYGATGAISIFGSTTSQAFTAREW